MTTTKKILILKLAGKPRVLLMRAIHGLKTSSAEEAMIRFNARADLLGKDWDWSQLKLAGKLTEEQAEAVTTLEFSPETARHLAELVDRLAAGEGIPSPPMGAPAPMLFEELAEILLIGRRFRTVADGKADDDTPPAIALAK